MVRRWASSACRDMYPTTARGARTMAYSWIDAVPGDGPGSAVVIASMVQPGAARTLLTNEVGDVRVSRAPNRMG